MGVVAVPLRIRHPLVRITVGHRRLGFHTDIVNALGVAWTAQFCAGERHLLNAHAAKAHAGARALLVGRADAVVVVDDRLGAADQAEDDGGDDQDVAHLGSLCY